MRFLICSLLLCSTGFTLSQAPAAKPKPKINAIAAMANPKEVDPKLPNVLIIGDSISIGYTVAVRELLAGKANVYRPPTNCGPTTNGLTGIDSWIGDKKWEVIHFNWGLHDLKFIANDPGKLVPAETPGAKWQVSLEDYEKNLRTLVERMKKTGAKLIWCTTTPVVPGTNGRKTEDVLKFNEAAARVMKDHGVETDDLYAFALPKLAEIQLPTNVHFKPEGSKVLAQQVAGEIEKALAK